MPTQLVIGVYAPERRHKSLVGRSIFVGVFPLDFESVVKTCLKGGWWGKGGMKAQKEKVWLKRVVGRGR